MDEPKYVRFELDPDAPVRPWTPERMREAKPITPRVLDPAKMKIVQRPPSAPGVRPAPSAPGGALVSAQKVKDRKSTPWRQVCKLFLDYADGMSGAASGVVIGKEYVLTAAHATASQRGGKIVSGSVVPAFEDGATPFGSYGVGDQFVPAPYSENQASPFDLAVVKVRRCSIGNPNAGRLIGDVVGSCGVVVNLDAQKATGVGYPSHPGGALEMYKEQLSCTLFKQDDGYEDAAPSEFSQGASGGPWFTEVRGATLISGLYASHVIKPDSPYYNYAVSPHFGPDLQYFFQHFIEVVDGAEGGALDPATHSPEPTRGGERSI